ncbi:tyrosine-type recombinase/integrase [Actinoplanes sp. NPDC023936]|uniref:tyrosine-type recombinase/integrase n=1 Tax=Actinoplanes sp. NPDC023936 TaxID=3154910 RepID=UPI0033CAF959
MTSEGSITKRCGCKDPATGKRLNSVCPKLRRSGGSWNPSHGSWGYQLELPVPPGRSRRVLRRSGFDDRDATRAELDHARSLLALAGDDTGLAVQIGEVLQACKNGIPLPDRDTVAARVRAGVPASAPTTTGQYLTEWLAARRGLSPKTIRGYGDHIRSYLIPHLGDIPLQSLRTSHIQAMFTALDARNEQIRAARASNEPVTRQRFRGVRPMGASSMIRLYATLRVALNDAVRRSRLIPHNPALGIELESGARPKARVWTPKAIEQWKASGQRPSPVMVWRPEQAGQFLDYAQKHDAVLYPMFELILHRGLRRGEAIGLRDFDVDLNEAYLSIVQQITAVGYTPITRKVKSDAGDRIIPLGPATVAGLTAYLDMRNRWQQVSGDTWPNTGLFFVRPNGQPWHPQAISGRFDYLVTKSGLPPVRLHDLRHCAATYLRHGGADLKEIQEVLGHSTIGLTSDTYTSVILELRRPNADAAANLIPREAA